MMQMVYVLQDRQTALIKIGISTNPLGRLQEINAEFGCEGGGPSASLALPPIP